MIKPKSLISAFFAIIFVILLKNESASGNSEEICDICKCFSSGNLQNIECKQSLMSSNAFSLSNVYWPINDGDNSARIKAFYHDIPMRHLSKPLEHARNKDVLELYFDNNQLESIDNEPFANFTNLESLSLINNPLGSLTKDFFKMPNRLKRLNMANNSLVNVNVLSTSNFSSLESLDLSYNKLTTLTTEFIDALSNCYELNFEGNQILAIGSYNKNTIYKWESLNLAQNKFSAITSSTFSSLFAIQNLNLNNNTISVIEKNALSHLTTLKLLELQHNQLKEISLELPDSLENCRMAHNNIVIWPLRNIPKELSKLELQNNHMVKLFELDTEFHNLIFLNLSDNEINFFPGKIFSNLETLDISFNELTSVPQDLGNRAPKLRNLILDHNPIETIQFVDSINVASLSFSNMPNLKFLDGKSFKNVVGMKIKNNGDGFCVDIKVSHCPLLNGINENAFNGLELCKLDLSYNQLTSIPKNLMNFSSLEEGIDLQGNPLTCDCLSEWMIEDIVVPLYQKQELQKLLNDLRCDSPPQLKNQRIVRYYKHKNPFCQASEKLMIQSAGFGRSLGDDSDQGKFLVHTGKGLYIIIALSLIVLLALITVGIYLTIDQKRQLHRKDYIRTYPLYANVQ